MKYRLVIVAVGTFIALGLELPRTALAVEFAAEVHPDDKSVNESNPLAEWELLKKPLAKQRKENLADKAHKVLGVFEAIGGVAAQLIGAGAAVDPEPIEQQLAPQFDQLLNAELRFVRAICQPDPEQYRTIKTAGNAGLKVALKKCSTIQAQMQQGRSGQPKEWPDPREIIAGALAKSVTQTLSVEQAKRYQLELERRAAARKRAAQLNLVARLDQELVLTSQQRSLLTETLKTNWKDSWGNQLEVFLYDGQFLPILPDAFVLPILNETQKEIWKGMPKQQYVGGWMQFGMMQGVFGGDVDVSEPVEHDEEKNKDEANKDELNKNQKGGKP